MISVVGIAAMLWVGGHILLVGSAEVGWHWPYDTVHHCEEDVHDAVAGLGARARLARQHRVSAVIGLVVGRGRARRRARAAVRQDDGRPPQPACTDRIAAAPGRVEDSSVPVRVGDP